MQTFGRYKVKSVIGQGGMGTVYLAEDPVIGREVAVKVILPESGLSESARREREVRFEREFKSAGTLSHGNLVTVYDAGLENNHAFIAMEYVPGESLAEVIEREERISFERIVEIGRQIGAGLDFAHQRGIVHRDVKPANILLTSEGSVKITDFGVAKLASTSLTRTGAALGSPRYMSPEMLGGQAVTGRADQFSMAIILFELLTGESPFAGDSVSKILYQIAHEPARRPQTLRPGLGDKVDAVFERGLSKAPKDRFPSCAALADALADALREGPEELPTHQPSAVASGAGEASADLVDLPLGREPAPVASRGSRREVVVGLVAVAALVAAVLAVRGGVPSFLGWPRGAEPELGLSEGNPPGTGPSAVALDLEVDSDPAGASIWVDGENRGEVTPARIRLEGTVAQQVEIELRLGDEAVAKTLLELDPEMPSRWAPTFVPPAVPFTIATSPPGARVVLNGERMPSPTPSQIQVDAVSSYRLRLELEEYAPAELEFRLADLDADQRDARRIEFTLAKKVKPGRLLVAFPFPAEVEIGGRKYAIRKRREIALSPGEYEVVVSAPEVFYRDRSVVRVGAGERLQIRVPAVAEVIVAATPSNCEVRIDGRVVGFVPVPVRLTTGRHEFEFYWPGLDRSLTSVEEIAADTKRILRAAPTETG